MYQHSFAQEDWRIIRTGSKQHEKQIQWSFEKKKARSYQTECENDLSLVSRGCGDPHKQSPLPTSPSSPQLPPELQATSSNRSSPSRTSKSVWQLPDRRAETPMLGGLRSRTERAAAPARDAPRLSSQESGQGGVARKGARAGALSCLSWDETEVCTHPPAGALQPSGSTGLGAAYGN